MRYSKKGIFLGGTVFPLFKKMPVFNCSVTMKEG
jgi:hypothetical protein